MFGQYPLQVNGFKDLHECLEAAMIEGEIESLHSAENSARSGQEVSAKKKNNKKFKALLKIKLMKFSFYSQMFMQVLKR